MTGAGIVGTTETGVGTEAATTGVGTGGVCVCVCAGCAAYPETGGEIGLVTPGEFEAMLDNSLACVTPKLRESDLDKSAAVGWNECVSDPGL